MQKMYYTIVWYILYYPQKCYYFYVVHVLLKKCTTQVPDIV